MDSLTGNSAMDSLNDSGSPGRRPGLLGGVGYVEPLPTQNTPPGYGAKNRILLAQDHLLGYRNGVSTGLKQNLDVDYESDVLPVVRQKGAMPYATGTSPVLRQHKVSPGYYDSHPILGPTNQMLANEATGVAFSQMGLRGQPFGQSRLMSGLSSLVGYGGGVGPGLAQSTMVGYGPGATGFGMGYGADDNQGNVTGDGTGPVYPGHVIGYGTGAGPALANFGLMGGYTDGVLDPYNLGGTVTVLRQNNLLHYSADSSPNVLPSTLSDYHAADLRNELGQHTLAAYDTTAMKQRSLFGRHDLTEEIQPEERIQPALLPSYLIGDPMPPCRGGPCAIMKNTLKESPIQAPVHTPRPKQSKVTPKKAAQSPREPAKDDGEKQVALAKKTPRRDVSPRKPLEPPYETPEPMETSFGSTYGPPNKSLNEIFQSEDLPASPGMGRCPTSTCGEKTSVEEPLKEPPPDRYDESFEEDGTWVTIFGYETPYTDFVLDKVAMVGTVQTFHLGTGGNWMHVKFATVEEAEAVIKLHGTMIAPGLMVGAKLRVKEGKPDGEKPAETVPPDTSCLVRSPPDVETLRGLALAHGDYFLTGCQQEAPERQGYLTKLLNHVFGW